MGRLKLTLLLFIALLLGFGIATTHSDYRQRQRQFSDSLHAYRVQYQAYKQDSIKLVKAISPPENAIRWKSSSGNAYLSASQGIEVHLKGLSWRGWFLDNNEPIVASLRNKFDAEFSNTIDNIKFDPDFQNNGYPDLIAKVVGSPSFYNPGLFSEYLGEMIRSEPRPFKSYELESCGGQKATMDLWLVTFDLTFRIEPSFNYSRNSEWKFDDRHPITNERDEWSRSRREFKEMRYDRLSVFLEFVPKNNFYIANLGQQGLLNPNGGPKIGIGAVECVLIEKVGEKGTNNLATTLGVDLEKGKSLPLYPTLNELKEIYSYKNFSDNDPFRSSHTRNTGDEIETYENLVNVCDQAVALADPNLFGQSKFSHVDIKNLGSWREEGSHFLSGSTYNADYFHAKFLVHLYVLGEWVVKDENISRFEARMPSSVSRPGVLDYLLPDFRLGFFGKAVASILLPLLVIMALSFFFPPIRMLINELLKRLFKLVLK